MQTPLATSFFQDQDFIRSCYIVAFICFIVGLQNLRTPVTARRGNVIAAVGMAIAVVATLLQPQVGNYGLIVVGSDAELDYERHDLPSTVHYVGPCIWLPPPDPETAAWLDRIPAVRPWVHATEATLHYGDPFVLRAAAQGLAGAQVEAVGGAERPRA